MNNGNSSKQVLLSVLGIAVLVIAVVGVSFAFFTYSRTGDNQLLTTGSIFFQFTDGQEITLTDQFPVADTTAQAWTNAKEDNKVIEFTIKGHNSSGDAIPFKIKAVSGTVMPEKTLFDDSEIKLELKETTTTDKRLTTNNFETPATVSSQGALATGITLGEGAIKAKEADETLKFELRMWIADTVTFGNAQSDKYKGDNPDDVSEKTKFSDLYYALKVQVEAGDAAA